MDSTHQYCKLKFLTKEESSKEALKNLKNSLSNDKEISDDMEQKAKQFALGKSLQSNHKYDEESCIESYIAGYTEDKWLDVKSVLPEKDINVLVYIQKF